MSSDQTPEARLNEIVAQRVRVRAAEEDLAREAAKLKKKKAEHKEAKEEVSEARRILDEILDDKPAGPLYEGAHVEHAGDGPIPHPDDQRQPTKPQDAPARGRRRSRKKN